jgi:hypothetical protein
MDRAQIMCDALVPLLPHAVGGLVVESARADGNLLVLTGRGVIDDPDTEDDSWTWRIVNPPLLVPDDSGEVERTSIDENGQATVIRYRCDPFAAFIEIVQGL